MNNHETDFYTWTQDQVALLRAGRFIELDIDNLIKEIEDMGRSERRELKSCLRVLLCHLLKWEYQPARRGNSWIATIEVQRESIRQCLQENPGLKPSCNLTLKDAYYLARLDAVRETNLSKSIFPTECPWTFEQIISNLLAIPRE